MTRDGVALSGVQTTVLGRPGFGQTLSRTDGMFDMAVNGGGILIVHYEKAGFLPAQRPINAPWQNFAFLPDVALIPVNSQVTPIDLDASAAIQVARGNPVTDADEVRQPTLLFSQGTTATMIMPNGSTQPLSVLNVRATEYTVGPNGPAAMPGELPPTSGYTYAVELSADEAIAAGAKSLNFSQPVIHYVENFLRFPVGGAVPVGFYDRDRAGWIPADNGRVIKITGVSAGLAVVDTVGAGTLPPLTLTTAELQQLALLYSAGQELWRVPVTHFSTGDCNWPYGLPPDAMAPDLPSEPREGDPDDDCNEEGSIIQCLSQTVTDMVPITGTPFQLRYGSERTRGRTAAFTLDIPLSGNKVPASLTRIQLEISLAGRLFTQTFPATPNQRTTFTWDGRDVYGRDVQGARVATVRVGYVYRGIYLGQARRCKALPAFRRPCWD